jgi:flavin-dependent dehydrogenase
MEPRQFDTDVIVVGGGPAGSAAAIACASRGLRVWLFERETFGGERPGEALHPGIEPLLAQLGVADRLDSVVGVRHEGIWIEWSRSRRFQSFGRDSEGRWRGFQVWRADFDTLLLQRARETGVEVFQPYAVTGILNGDDGASGVTTGAGPVTGRMIIDATGRADWLSRMLGIERRVRSPRLIARYGYADGYCPTHDLAPTLVGDRSGWLWTAMVRPGTYQWTRVVLDASAIGPDWMPEAFSGLVPHGRSRGADVTWRIASEVAGRNWFMVGDAAARLDPTSSHGVLKALMSGIAAGHLIAAVLSGTAPAAGAAAAYHDWVAGWFADDAVQLSKFYRELGVEAFA